MYFTNFVDGEMDGVGGASTKGHGGDTSVKAGGALGFEDGAEDVANTDGFNRAGTDGLHMGFDCVDREHRHVLDQTGNRPGNHVLPEMEAVVGGYGDVRVELWGLWDRAEIRVLEFGGFGGHGIELELLM